ncbi:MAG: phenylalanine--tRNA ligase subunit alpha [Chlamydiia bacterium]|nr:phenylalanine--tRNA ligase subunit alpha [Chlamydiia bacterium]
MNDSIQTLLTSFQEELKAIQSTKELEDLKVKYLGKKGPVQGLMKHLKDLSPEERPVFGQAVNDLKVEISNTLEDLAGKLVAQEEFKAIQSEKVDITEPGRRRFLGSKHILTASMDEILDVLVSMGFSVQYGPDVDNDWYNFESLNFPPDHPARDMQDTFYLKKDRLLRTHTSNMQVRIMESEKLPIRVAFPGRAFRNETITARSHVFFQQVEGLYIDKGVTFKDLMSTLDEFFLKLFHKKVETRFRPSYFPFVEPGLEVDIRCIICNGSGCGVCKNTGWLEVLGAGMVHPNVLLAGGIDPEVYSGYAWGMGLERLVMIKHGIKDIRLFTENNLKFLAQF